MTREDGHEHWCVPQNKKIKVNSDAAIFDQSSSYSYAFVVRDEYGQLIEARSKCNEGRISHELAEAIGVREALSWIKHDQHIGVELETDCLMAI